MQSQVLIFYLGLFVGGVCYKFDFLSYVQSSHSLRKVLQDDVCSVSEIKFGFNADPKRYPYMVSLQMVRIMDSVGNKKFIHTCGGTLIANNLVLTAAHCIWVKGTFIDSRQDKSLQGNLIPGTVWAALNPYCRHSSGVNRVAVTKFYLPDVYDENIRKGNDITLLQLSEDFLGYQGPYCNYRASKNANLGPGLDATVLGWGAMNYRQTREVVVAQQSDPMQEAQLSYVNTSTCASVMKMEINITSMLCFNDPDGETGVCVRDSGGPVLIKGADAQGDVEIGITSWNMDTQCTDFELPFVFTKVSAYVDWIDEIKSSVAWVDVKLPPAVESTDTVHEDVSPSPPSTDFSFIIMPPPAATIDEGKCSPQYNTELNGSLIVSPNVENEQECCDVCDSDAVCNVWVYCPSPLCLISFNVCYLYYSDALVQGNNAQVLQQGSEIALTSGTFPLKGGQAVDAVCEFEVGANYQGVNVSQPLSVESQERCCSLCAAEPFCNTFVYCPRPEGCRNPGAIRNTLLEAFRCDLKYQQSVANGQPPKVFGRNTDFVSGIVANKEIGQFTDEKCFVEPNANAKGIFLYGHTQRAESAFECCAVCQSNLNCNVWNYCPSPSGCGNQKANQCDLKFQSAVANQEGVQYYEKGPSTPFTSGSLPSKIFQGSCIITTNINYRGTFLLGLTAEDEGECCGKCKFYNGCNVFVFCGKMSGCRNSKEIIPYKTCDLKYQVEVQNFKDPLNFAEGFNVDFSGGIIPGRRLQQDCTRFENSNLMGVVLTSYFVNSADECCEGCNGVQQCNVWVYCEKQGGCLSGKTFVEANVCFLKFQQTVAEGKTPMAWEQGSKANFTSGFILGKLIV